MLGNGRLDVPVRELAAAPPAYGDGVGVPEDGARLDRVDARAVRNGDVDAEVEVATEARVVEGAPDDVLRSNGFTGQLVGVRERGRTKRHDACRDDTPTLYPRPLRP